MDFANTHVDRFGRVERFGDAAGLSAWLAEHGFAEAASDATEADAASARELRDAVITLLLSHSDDSEVSEQTRDETEDFLRRTALRYPLVAVANHDGADLAPAHDGLPGAFGSVFAAVTKLGLKGSWSRLKACRNRGCHFAFLDRTRNASGAYCSGTCSSQVAMRKYRQRRRATS